MQNIKTFHVKCIGESHVKKNIPCQDAAGTYEDQEKQIYIGVVSDGHGSKDYFRSENGSQILVNLTIELLKVFIKNTENSLFQDEYLTRGTLTSILNSRQNDNITKHPSNTERNESFKQNEIALNQLFKSIIGEWNAEILKHWNANKPTKDFLLEKGISVDRITDFLNDKNIQIAYGCTLLAFAKTSNYWFAFQLGDGRCIAFDDKMNGFLPIPDDEQCQGNTTTSMCQSNAFDNFRYAYGTKKNKAIFIGSDGMEGRHGDMDYYTIPQIKQDYLAIVKVILNNGFENGFKMVNEAIPAWAQKDQNKKDDLSIACFIDLENKDESINNIIIKDKKQIEQKQKETEDKLKKEQDELNDLENKIVQKTIILNEVIAKTNALNSEIDSSKLAVHSLESKLQEEHSKQSRFQKEIEDIKTQTEKLEIEINNFNRFKENKIQIIQKYEAEKIKAKSLIEELGEKISKFLGMN